ncbi:MAG: hypothetical protein AB7K24_03730 [Gemmataceae bacterium]
MAVFWTLTVDTEEEWDWHAGWAVHDLSVRNIERLPAFQDQCSARGAAVSYFANHAVLADKTSATILAELARRERVEVGMHIHPWNTPPLTSDKVASPRETYLHNLPASDIEAKLTTVYRAFAAAGLPAPTSFRGGRYSTSPAIQGFLQRHAFVTDSSIVPYTAWSDEGAPDFRGRGLLPARLPPGNERETALWELPLTRGFSRRGFDFWGRAFAAIEHSPLRKLKLIGLANRLGLVRRVWLNFEQHSADEMLGILPALERAGLPFVSFTLHSSSLLPGASPYARTQAEADRLLDQIDRVLVYLEKRPGYEPATMSQIARQFEAG